MLRNGHVRFGGRPAETHPAQARQGAAGRPYTQHRARDGWVYCPAVIDAYSRRIVGWSISDRITAEIVVDALEMARWRRRPNPGPWFMRTAERNTPAGSSGTGCAKPGCSDRWAESPPASTTPSSRASGPRCNASSSTAPSGTRGHSSRRRCSSGSRGSTTPAAGTPASATSVPPTTKHFTPPQKSRHDQHTRTVRETGSGSRPSWTIPHRCTPSNLIVTRVRCPSRCDPRRAARTSVECRRQFSRLVAQRTQRESTSEPVLARGDKLKRGGGVTRRTRMDPPGAARQAKPSRTPGRRR